MNDNVSWCQREDCDGPYTATDPNQKYCSKRCSKREEKRRRIKREESANKESRLSGFDDPCWIWNRPLQGFSIAMNPRLSTIDEAEEIYRQLKQQQTLEVQRKNAELLTRRVAGSTPQSNQAYKDKQWAWMKAEEDVYLFGEMAKKINVLLFPWQIQLLRRLFYKRHIDTKAKSNESKTVIDGDPGALIHIWQSAMPNGLFLTPDAMQVVSVTLKDGDTIVEIKERTEH